MTLERELKLRYAEKPALGFRWFTKNLYFEKATC